MNTPEEARRIEQRSLRFWVGVNAVMALAGFSAHVLNRSSARCWTAFIPQFWWGLR